MEYNQGRLPVREGEDEGSRNVPIAVDDLRGVERVLPSRRSGLREFRITVDHEEFLRLNREFSLLDFSRTYLNDDRTVLWLSDSVLFTTRDWVSWSIYFDRTDSNGQHTRLLGVLLQALPNATNEEIRAGGDLLLRWFPSDSPVSSLQIDQSVGFNTLSVSPQELARVLEENQCKLALHKVPLDPKFRSIERLSALFRQPASLNCFVLRDWCSTLYFYQYG
jgi:hypothetical protein